ncbi:MAG: methyltransferase domain-containing protein [Chitinophagales bacterium]
MIEEQKQAIRYYNKFSRYYDWLSPKLYYDKARTFAIKQLDLKPEETLLNLPCGTGQNFEYFQQYLKNTGTVIGIDLSDGMISQAKKKMAENNWTNVKILKGNATNITKDWIAENVSPSVEIDAVLCDLGLSGFPQWESVIDNMISILKPNGKIVIMDWYIPKFTFRGLFIKWIGKGEVDRPIYQYLETKTASFSVNNTFNRGGVFVASGIKK